MLSTVRPPAFAGSFYPAARRELARVVDELLAAAPRGVGPCPKVLVVPHAGYVYSGPIAAAAFARIAPWAAQLERVVLIGPTHRVPVDGLAWPGAARMATPLGEVEVDVGALAAVPDVAANAVAHAREHSLEVELPFLQALAPRAKIVPLVASRARPDQVGHVLEALWGATPRPANAHSAEAPARGAGGPETLIVVSTDLSHYLPYAIGRARDQHTAARIVACDAGLSGDEACGAIGLNGLLWVARRKRLRLELLDLRSSGDTAGSHDEVVGYGAFAAYEAAS